MAEAVGYLLEKGADPNAMNNVSVLTCTVLIYSIAHHRWQNLLRFSYTEFLSPCVVSTGFALNLRQDARKPHSMAYGEAKTLLLEAKQKADL